MTPTKTAEQIFIADLRRVLINKQIYDANLKWLKDNSLCPSRLKYAINNAINANRRLFEEIREHYPKDSQERIDKDLTSERIQDINVLMDLVAQLEDVGLVNEELERHLKTI